MNGVQLLHSEHLISDGWCADCAQQMRQAVKSVALFREANAFWAEYLRARRAKQPNDGQQQTDDNNTDLVLLMKVEQDENEDKVNKGFLSQGDRCGASDRDYAPDDDHDVDEHDIHGNHHHCEGNDDDDGHHQLDDDNVDHDVPADSDEDKPIIAVKRSKSAAVTAKSPAKRKMEQCPTDRDGRRRRRGQSAAATAAVDDADGHHQHSDDDNDDHDVPADSDEVKPITAAKRSKSTADAAVKPLAKRNVKPSAADGDGRRRRRGQSAAAATAAAKPKHNGQVCHICGGVYQWKMERHIEAAHSVLTCDICGRTFNHKVPLRRHFRDDHGFQRFACDVCGRSNLTRSLWLRHQDMHRPKLERLFACDQCGNSYPTLHNLRQHVARVHVHKEVACAECGKTFHNGVRLRDHMIRHRPKTITCPEPGCPRMFWLVKEMKEHCRTVHEKDRKYVCEVCGKAFLVNAQLKKHHLLGRCRGADGSGRGRGGQQQHVQELQLQHQQQLGNTTLSSSETVGVVPAAESSAPMSMDAFMR